MTNAIKLACLAQRLEPGIFWERTGGKTYRLTIRREVEYVPDMTGLLNAWQSVAGRNLRGVD